MMQMNGNEGELDEELCKILVCNCGFNLSNGDHYDDCPRAAKAAIQSLLERRVYEELQTVMATSYLEEAGSQGHVKGYLVERLAALSQRGKEKEQ